MGKNFACDVFTKHHLNSHYNNVKNLPKTALNERFIQCKFVTKPLTKQDMEGLKNYLFSLGLYHKNASKELVEKAKIEYKRQYNIIYQKKYAKKVQRVNVRLDISDFHLIQESAKKHHQKTSTHLRELALAYLKQQYIVPNTQELQKIQLEINAIGKNINQIAKKVNTYGSSRFDLNELLNLLERLEKAITQKVEHPKLKTRQKIKKTLSETKEVWS